MVAVFFVTALVSYTDRLILGVLVDPLRHDLGLSDSGVSLLQGAAFTLVYVFTSLPLGRWADRGRRRTLLIAGASLWCLAAVGCGLAPDFRTLFVGRLLIGVGEAALVPAAVSMIADSFPPARRGLAIGLFAMGTVIGGPMGISVGGLLLAAASGGHLAQWPLIGDLAPWRQVLVTVGASGLVAPLLLLTIREPNRVSVVTDVSLRAAVRHFVSARWRLIPIYAGAALLSIGDYGLLSWAPTTLSRQFNWQPDRIGVAFGVITALTGIGGALIGGWVSDIAEKRGGTRARLAVCLVAAAIATVAAAMISAGYASVVLVGIGLWTLASTVGGTGVVAVLQEVLPGQIRGTGISLFTFSNTLVGLGAGPTLVALGTDHLYRGAPALAFAITTIVAPAALLSCISLSYARRR
jgi:MFS family permease